MSETEDPAHGAQPLPGVSVSSERSYPLLLERLVTIACLLSALLMIGPTLSADLPLPGFVQTLLAFCGLPVLGLVIARLLILPIQSVATS